MVHVLSGDFAGEWWLPASPDKTWGGFLHLADGQRPQLHVAGVMTEFTKRLASLIEHPVIHGVTADGKLVTLFGGTEIGGQMQLFSETVGATIVTAPRAYIGNHFDSEPTAGFRRMALRLTYLDAWFRRHGSNARSSWTRRVDSAAACSRLSRERVPRSSCHSVH